MKMLIYSVILITSAAGTLISDIQQQICYTQWFDRDDPSSTGDWETLTQLRTENPGKICLKPLTIEATTLSGVPAEKTGQVIHLYDSVEGFICLNTDQKNEDCLDYRVRFACPCTDSPPLLDSFFCIE